MTEAKTIETVNRFLFLNAYAFLLLALGAGGIGFVCWCPWCWAVRAVVLVASLVCLRGALTIPKSWSDKKRKYAVLMQRNSPTLRPDTFGDFMQAPCGRLLARIVLHDLGCPERYAELRRLRKPLGARLRECGRPQRTVIYVNPDFKRK